MGNCRSIIPDCCGKFTLSAEMSAECLERRCQFGPHCLTLCAQLFQEFHCFTADQRRFAQAITVVERDAEIVEVRRQRAPAADVTWVNQRAAEVCGPAQCDDGFVWARLLPQERAQVG